MGCYWIYLQTRKYKKKSVNRANQLLKKPLFNSKDSFLIKTLLKVYNEETNSNLQPMAIGGGTYARALPIGAAFGPEFPGEDAPVHEPNEYITVKNIEKMSRIYKKAIKELTE